MGFSQKSLIIRADANPNIGSGHVMRTLALAQRWIAQGGRACFAIHGAVSSILDRLRQEKCKIANIDAQPGSVVDARLLKQLAQRHSGDAIVIDGYQFDSQYLSAVRNSSWRTLVLDDDLRLAHYDCDLLLNQNLEATPESYAEKTSANLLLGAEYALLRNEFVCHEQQPKSIRDSCSRVLVTMGGSDAPNATGKTIVGLHSTSLASVFRIVVGGNNPHRSELTELASLDSRFELIFDATDMSAHYLWADLAICAGGSSNWELSYFGVPRIVIVLADNQVAVAENLAETGAVLNLGSHQSLTPDDIANAVTSLMEDSQRRRLMSLASQRLVDGKGAQRVMQKLLSTDN